MNVLDQVNTIRRLKMKERQRVTLQNKKGCVAHCTVVAIDKDSGSVVLAPLKGAFTGELLRKMMVGDSVVVHALSWFGKDKQLMKNEMVFVETKEGKGRFWVDLQLEQGYAVLRPTEEPGALGMRNRDRLIRYGLGTL